MSRVTSLTNMPEAQLNRWIKRIGLLFVVVLVAFVAFYAVDRFRPAATPIIDRELLALEEAVRTDPADIASRGRLADLYVAAQRYDDAIAQYSEVLRTGKADEAAYAGRGVTYQLKGELDAAAADFTKVIEIGLGGEMANVDPMLQTAYYGLGAIALAQDRADDAIDSLLKALAINRGDADTMNLLGAAYVKAGQAEKAVEPLRRAILFVPSGWPDPYRSLADAYAATGETEQAEWAAAMAQGQAGDVPGAVARLEVIADGKAALDARIGLGLLAETSGDNAAAGDWYRKALELDAENQAAQFGLGRITDPTEGHASLMPVPSAEGGN